MEPTPWPNDRAERVSVNSFGIGGTNAHVSPNPLRPAREFACILTGPAHHGFGRLLWVDRGSQDQVG